LAGKRAQIRLPQPGDRRVQQRVRPLHRRRLLRRRVPAPLHRLRPLADFPEPSLDFLANIPEEPLPLPSFSATTSESLSEPPSPARWQQVDDFFQYITNLFQIDPLPIV